MKFNFDISNQTKEEIPNEVTEITLNMCFVADSLPKIGPITEYTKKYSSHHTGDTFDLSDPLDRAMMKLENESVIAPMATKDRSDDIEKMNKRHAQLMLRYYSNLMWVLDCAQSLPNLHTIKFDDSLKLGFLDVESLNKIAQKLPRGVKHLYLSDQGFTRSPKEVIIGFFRNLQIQLITLQISNARRYMLIIVRLLEERQIQNIKHLILSRNNLFSAITSEKPNVPSLFFQPTNKGFTKEREELIKVFDIVKRLELDTLAITNDDNVVPVLDIVLPRANAKNLVFSGNNYFMSNDYSDLARGLAEINPTICSLDLSNNNKGGNLLSMSTIKALREALDNAPDKLAIDLHGNGFNESLFKTAVEEKNVKLVRILFKGGVAIKPQDLNAAARKNPAVNGLVTSFLNFRRMEPVLYARMLAENRKRSVPAIGGLSNTDLPKLVSEMLTGHPKSKLNG